MADPLFDEELIVHLLKTAVSPENVARLQHGTVQALVDLYDRKVTREEFTSSASLCLALYAQTAKLWLLSNVEDVYNEGALDTERFKLARDGLCDVIRKQSEGVIDIVKRLQQCPTTQDKLH